MMTRKGDTLDEVTSGLTKFVRGYNDVRTVTTDAISTYLSNMEEKTKGYEAELNQIGITILEDGTLEYSSSVIVDDDYKKAYATLFGENAAYGSLMKIYAKNIFDTTMKTESLGITIDSYA